MLRWKGFSFDCIVSKSEGKVFRFKSTQTRRRADMQLTSIISIPREFLWVELVFLAKISFKCCTWELLDAFPTLNFQPDYTTIHDLNLVSLLMNRKQVVSLSQQRHQRDKVQEIENSFYTFLPSWLLRSLILINNDRQWWQWDMNERNWPYCRWMMTMQVTVACLTFQFTSYFQSLVILITYWLRCIFQGNLRRLNWWRRAF